MRLEPNKNSAELRGLQQQEFKFEAKLYPILYVDDESLALELFRYNFGDEFKVFTAGSVAEAWSILENNDIALLLSDQRMPGISGSDFLAKIRQTRPEIIRILVTGYVDFESVVAAINAGHVYHYVEKPWNDEDLRLMLRRGLEHFHLLRERDRMQAERMDTLEKMARSNRLSAVGTLAAGIAHEIRNPLSAIITFHQMLPEKIQELQHNPQILESDEFWTRFSKLPLREVERIKTLVQELLDFSRDSGSQYQFRSQDIIALVESVLPMIESDLRRNQINLIKEFASDLPPVEVDPDKIKQVIINLILNSMHATPPQGEIILKIFLEQPGEIDPTKRRLKNFSSDDSTKDKLVMVVQDTGSGIESKDMERVFDPFFTTKDPGVGTGLGLTMCHYIVANHGGEMTLTSVVGQGTEVGVRLPLAAADRAVEIERQKWKKEVFLEAKSPPAMLETPSGA